MRSMLRCLFTVGLVTLTTFSCPPAVDEPSRDAGRTEVPDASVSACEAATIELDRYVNGAWVERARLPVVRNSAAVASHGTKIYLVGGSDTQGPTDRVDIYDVEQNTWQSGPRLPRQRMTMGAAFWADTLFVVGGLDVDGGWVMLDRVDRLEPGASTWASGPSLPSPRRGAAVVMTSDSLWALGGDDGTGPALDEVVRLAAPDAGWTKGAALPGPRTGAAAVWLAGAVVIGGGNHFDGVGDHYLDEVTSHSGGGWKREPPLSLGRVALAAAPLGPRYAVFAGGYADRAPEPFSAEVAALDVCDGGWKTLPSLPDAMGGVALVTVGTRLFAIGGARSDIPRRIAWSPTDRTLELVPR